MKLKQIRDQLLASLQVQFQAKVKSVTYKENVKYPNLDRFLLDLANNLAQGFDGDDE